MKTAILTGPTATGKSALALKLAREHGRIEIINADSLLVYRGMDIGTAKPTQEERSSIPHHLIDIRNPDEAYTAGDFFKDATKTIEEIHARGNRALITGGTGFYLKALLYGLWDVPKGDPMIRSQLEMKTNEELFDELKKKDSIAALKIGPNDRYRLVRALELIVQTGKKPTELQKNLPEKPNPNFVLWILDRDNPELYERISRRTQSMLKEGLVDEARMSCFRLSWLCSGSRLLGREKTGR
jgi:tRNA dimethylallyltransferase